MFTLSALRSITIPAAPHGTILLLLLCHRRFGTHQNCSHMNGEQVIAFILVTLALARRALSFVVGDSLAASTG